MRRVAYLTHGQDRGAIALIVAVLMCFGVVLAAAALTIDVGSINAERRTLQNGADAAAMSVAQTCVATKTCPSPTDSALVSLVNSNDAKDHFTKIARIDGTAAICGKINSDPLLPACASLKPGLADCPPPQKLPAQYVRVYTQTQTSSDNTKTILPPIFGQTIVGGYKGVTQQTCASVGLGSKGSSPDAMPIVVAKCAYDSMIAKNTPSFPVMPPSPGASQTSPPPFPTKGGIPVKTTDYSKYIFTIWSHINPQNAADAPVKCNASNSGLYLPGGFGWTTTKDNNHCTADFNSDTGTVPVGTGSATPSGCKIGGTSAKLFVGTTVYIPVMTGETADGNNYIIDGLAGFYVAGYSAPAISPNTYDGYTDNGAIKIPKLKGPADGFWGWFTDEYVGEGSFGSTTNPKGPTVIGNIG